MIYGYGCYTWGGGGDKMWHPQAPPPVSDLHAIVELSNCQLSTCNCLLSIVKLSLILLIVFLYLHMSNWLIVGLQLSNRLIGLVYYRHSSICQFSKCQLSYCQLSNCLFINRQILNYVRCLAYYQRTFAITAEWETFGCEMGEFG
jgi:hypothetical protein